MPIKLNTASGGGVILTGANTASDKTITVPADDGTMIYANSSGNVGIGTTSPGFKLEVVGGTNNGIHIKDAASATVYGGLFTQSASLGLYARSNHALTFGTNDTERARIDSSGNLLVGRTGLSATERLGVTFGAGNEGIRTVVASTALQYHAVFNNGSTVGAISTNGSATTYSTSSDYRLKENVQPMTGALAKVAALKPCTYTWKFDGSDGQGFIAHELAEVMPDCVTGEKDAMEADGVTPRYQGVDTSFLVATLTAAIQEQQQMIETLQAKVAALEAK